jgi:[glutamine synthetase] adenylyltransferase / [glutamine synthetase]-adenylyl-L-tyrosine phosphorylase
LPGERQDTQFEEAGQPAVDHEAGQVPEAQPNEAPPQQTGAPETRSPEAWPEVTASADPDQARLGLARLAETAPRSMERVREDCDMRRYLVAAMASGPFLTRICVTDPMALAVLSRISSPVEAMRPLARWKALEVLRIAAMDLSGELTLTTVGEILSDLAGSLLEDACAEAGLDRQFAVIGMGKLGARELNYGSDIDIVFAGSGDGLRLLELVRPAWRTDLDLRPEGRAGPLVRSLAAYEAYWDRWAATWEFQALLKARPVAGEAALGREFAEAAAQRVWGRPLGADELRSLRDMKARAEQIVGRRGLSQREIKLGSGGIRDIEFAVQLLQLVHGREDPALRVPGTLAALDALAAGGYVAREDAAGLGDAYRFSRAVEHRLQLFEDRQVHALPRGAPARGHLARVMGYRDHPGASALSQFETDLGRHQAEARAIHERLFFRPLLEAFSSRPRRSSTAAGAPAEVVTEANEGPVLAPAAVEQRLAAFGFSDARRTREAVAELTQGFSRTSRLMRSMVPLLLDWLSASPSPDLGLLGLRRLATGPHRRAQLSALFRESPEAARQLCLLLGTSPLFVEGYEHHPDQLALLASGPPPVPGAAALERRAWEAIGWRARPDWWRGLAGLVRGEMLQAQARDVLGRAELAETERCTTAVAEAVVRACLGALASDTLTGTRLPAEARTVEALSGAARQGPGPKGVAIVAMGRFGGAELSYASDLDVMIVFDDDMCSPQAAEALAEELLKLVNGVTPVQRLFELDLSLRPEGKKGPLARSLKAFESYYDRWAQLWERQALLRGRLVAGDTGVGERFRALAEAFVWRRPLSEDDFREIRRVKARMERERVPAGEDPEFHLKLGPGSLSDVEWTVQLLQLRAKVPAQGTLDALEALVSAGALGAGDAVVLAEAYRFCEATRNRLFLVHGRPGDSLPPPGHQLTALARSLGTTAPELRDQYRRLTRRCRRVVEQLFYGKT